MVIEERPSSWGYREDNLDPHTHDEEPSTSPIEELVKLFVDLEDATNILKLRKNLN